MFWSKIECENKPTPRKGHTFVVMNENLYVFGAGEAKQMSIIRKLFKEKHGLKASQINFTGYWRKTI